jgi:hypothetical protein
VTEAERVEADCRSLALGLWTRFEVLEEARVEVGATMPELRRALRSAQRHPNSAPIRSVRGFVRNQMERYVRERAGGP